MIFINKQNIFIESIKQIKLKDKIAFDCEFIRETSFVPILCLIQIATDDEIYIIDPLNIDITPLLEILQDVNILKIMHSCDQDIDVFYKNFDVIPYPIFDTQIAASFVGYGDAISYAKLVRKITKKLINKENKLTNWKLRPLKTDQINYAVNDVKYLFLLEEKLEIELQDLRRKEWFLEESEIIYKKDNYYQEPNLAWQRISHNSESPYFLNYLRGFAKLRENLAAKENRPRRFIIKDELIVTLAKLKPKKPEDITNDRILKRSIDKKLIDNIIEVAQEVALEKKELISDKKNREANNKEEIIDILKIYLKYIAKNHNIAVKNIANSADLKDLVKGKKTRFMSGWRYNIFGKFAANILNGEVTIKIKNGKVIFPEN